MERNYFSVDLGQLTPSEMDQVLKIPCEIRCLFSFIHLSQTSRTTQHKIILEIRGNYILQVVQENGYILSGFKCDYSINFEILRTTPTNFNKLGTPQSLQFVFTSQNKRRIKLFPSNINQFQNFSLILQKKYIVQLGFHESFKAIRILGKGLTATVYKALRFRDSKQVAIKCFKRALYFQTYNGKLSFQKQFKILSIIDHKNVCRLQSVYETQNTTYIVMENLALSLYGWIQKYGFPSVQTATKMVYQLLKGVQYLHSKGIMHRDLKPENIMIRKDTKQNIQIVVVDLGLAQYVNQQKFLFTRCGTPGYVAPEILGYKNGPNRYNQACDIFSLGVIFHILFFKKPIFEGTQIKQVIKLNTECSINFQADYMNILCPTGKKLMERMLQKNPQQRISALDALNHEFFKSEHLSQKIESTVSSIKNIE